LRLDLAITSLAIAIGIHLLCCLIQKTLIMQ
jgi:hypothetical protein